MEGPTFQTKNLQARGTTLQAGQNDQEMQVGRKGNRQQLQKPKVSNQQRQTSCQNASSATKAISNIEEKMHLPN